MLEAAGSDVELHNSAGKTGHEPATIAAQQEEQAKLTPFRHGHGLHLGCESLEPYLDLREKMLDEDVAAGIRLWHTKQAVYHFDKTAMEQLEATVKDLQAKSFDVAVSLCPPAPPPFSKLTCSTFSFTSPTSEAAASYSTARASARLLSVNLEGEPPSRSCFSPELRPCLTCLVAVAEVSASAFARSSASNGAVTGKRSVWRSARRFGVRNGTR